MGFGIAHDLPTLPKIAHHHAGGCLNTPLQMPIHHVCMAYTYPYKWGGGDALHPCRAHRIPVQGDGGCGDKPAPFGGRGQIG